MKPEFSDRWAKQLNDRMEELSAIRRNGVTFEQREKVRLIPADGGTVDYSHWLAVRDVFPPESMFRVSSRVYGRLTAGRLQQFHVVIIGDEYLAVTPDEMEAFNLQPAPLTETLKQWGYNGRSYGFASSGWSEPMRQHGFMRHGAREFHAVETVVKHYTNGVHDDTATTDLRIDGLTREEHDAFKKLLIKDAKSIEHFLQSLPKTKIDSE